MDSETEATTRSSATVRRAERWSEQHGVGAQGRHPAGGGGAGQPAARPGPHRLEAGVPGCQHLADQDADGRAGRAEAGQDQHEHGDEPHAHLDQQVDGQRPVGPVRLEQAAVEGEEDEEGRRGQDGGDPDAAGLVEEHGHAVAAQEDDDHPDQDEHGALPVHPAGPAAHEVAACRPRASS